MAEPLFYVDLSEDARDYRHTALEPGLPLLDRQGMNFAILRRWLGDYIAEPEWRNENVIGFYMTDEDRGRLEDVDCQPATQGELQKQFAADLDTLRAKVKKIRPESSTEEMVLRIVRKNSPSRPTTWRAAISTRTSSSAGRARKNGGCCGASATSGRISSRCGPGCGGLPTEISSACGRRRGGRARKRKRTGLTDVLTSPWLAIALMLLIGAFLYFTWPKLVVTPAQWSGPLGSRIEYKVEDQRWFFFSKDVTPLAMVQSNDPQVVELGPRRRGAREERGPDSGHGLVGRSSSVYATVEVGPPEPPDSLTIEPPGRPRWPSVPRSS